MEPIDCFLHKSAAEMSRWQDRKDKGRRHPAAPLTDKTQTGTPRHRKPEAWLRQGNYKEDSKGLTNGVSVQEESSQQPRRHLVPSFLQL